MIGVTVSHFRIVEKFSSAEMGLDHKAQNTRLDCPVARKYFPIGSGDRFIGRSDHRVIGSSGDWINA